MNTSEQRKETQRMDKDDVINVSVRDDARKAGKEISLDKIAAAQRQFEIDAIQKEIEEDERK